MKKIFFFSICILILLSITYLITNKKNDYYEKQTTPKQLQTDISNNKTKIIYFYQTSCTHCAKVTPIIVPLAKKMNIDMKIINLEKYEEGWDQFKIEATPTIISYKSGKEKGRIVGEQSEEVFKKWFQKNK